MKIYIDFSIKLWCLVGSSILEIWYTKHRLKYSSDKINSWSCKCSILLGLNFVEIKNSFPKMNLFDFDIFRFALLTRVSLWWTIKKINKSELWNCLSNRGLPYFFEVGSQTFRNDCKISRSQPQNSTSIVLWPQWSQNGPSLYFKNRLK